MTPAERRQVILGAAARVDDTWRAAQERIRQLERRNAELEARLAALLTSTGHVPTEE